MTNEELLEALNKQFESIDKRFEAMDKRFDSIEKRLGQMEEDIEEIKETAEITRNGVNALIEWAEDCGNAIKFPLPKIAK